MVRTYVRKTNQGQWTQKDMRISSDKVLAKQVTIRKAAEIYNVPYTSLQRRVTFSRGVVKNLGGQQTMDRDTEMKLANRLTYLAGRGFGSCSKPEGLSRARINGIKKEKVAEFYKTFEKVVEENDLRGCVYNVDKTGMPLNNQPPNIIAKKGSKDVVSMISVKRGQNVTVLACMNAAGQFIPQFVLFKGVRKRHDFMIGMTEKGWAATVGNATKGFEKTGIFPLNANAIPDHKFIGDTLDQDGNTPESNNEQQLDVPRRENGTAFFVQKSLSTHQMKTGFNATHVKNGAMEAALIEEV
ncbi:hypothetical protein ILUMI_10245 [Ignelater luminosus]|uniref:HTH psq-type domain-containing protein n=1 Tax=Ignelater luminosus TaxID=2038154 RepID=A0A8K0D2F5_IGNLU|nr:hypothetical protein ILUMI_10245 [Ignelater luminosus]